MSPPTSPPASPRSLRSTYIEDLPPSPQMIFNEIVHKILDIKEFTEIVYEDVKPEDGELISRSLVADERVERRAARVNFNAYTGTLRVKIMPTELHDVHQRWAMDAVGEWIYDGYLTRDEKTLLCGGVGTTFKGFAGIYQGSRKEPDFYFQADTADFPAIVIESGWSESFPHLRADKNIWMQGNTSVQLTILLRWTKISGGRVKGSVEVWRRAPAGGLTVVEMAIFPPPVPLPPSERIEFTRGQLYGPLMIAGRNPATILSLEIPRLRLFATEVITKDLRMVPA